MVVCVDWGGRHSTSGFGSSSSSLTKAESFRHFSGGRRVRLRFRRGTTQPSTSPHRSDTSVLGFAATAGWSWLNMLHRGWC